MNQIATQQERVPMDSVGITTGSTGSKIAPQNLGEVVKFAEVMCRADIALPKHLRGNAGACMAVALQALDWQMNPFAVASKSYSVNGQIAYEAQLIVAVVNTRSGIEGRIKYRFEGEGQDRVCIASGKLDGEEFEVRSPKLKDITPKNSPLWKSDPDQQQCYYTGRSWARRFTPEVILGVYDRDEVEQFQGPDNAKNITPAFDPFADDAIVPAHETRSEVLDGAAASTTPASKSAPVIEYGDITDTGEPSQALPDTDGEGCASIPEPSDDEVAGVTSPPAPATSDNPERDLLIKYARDVLPRAAEPNARIDALNAIEKRWMQQVSTLTADGQAKAEVIAKSMRAIFNKKTSLESAASYFADALDTTEAAITGKEDA